MIVTRFIGAATLFSGLAMALPQRLARDSSINEPAVSAPNGTPITEGTQPMQTPTDNGSSDGSNLDSSSEPNVVSSVVWDSSPTIAAATVTTVAWNSYQTPTYGSGSSNWGSSGESRYNDCVSQCLAQYGNAPQPWLPPTVTEPAPVIGGGGSGNGVTHTVIVAPTQGVLRYLPFAVNASVGDTVRFMWGANNHTVTKSSELTPCNKTLEGPFASGLQLKDFVFDQVVNDTNPVFFHCTVPTHCQKGMFGIINPPSNFGSGTSVSLMMSEWTSSNPDLAAYSAYSSSVTQNNTAIARWGGNIDVASLPEWSHPLVAENVMYTRTFLASNPEAVKQDGTVDLGSSAHTPLMIPQDISVALSNSNAAPSTSGASGAPATSSGAAPTSSDASSAPPSNLTSGAMTTSPKFIVALTAAAASLLLL